MPSLELYSKIRNDIPISQKGKLILGGADWAAGYYTVR